MNIKSHLSPLLVAVALVAAAPMFAQHSTADSSKANDASASSGKLIRVSEKDAAWAAAARKTYPMDVCVVSGEKLGSMGKSPEYIYRTEGQPDRLVVFCCSGCDEDFMKDPADHLAKIDAAGDPSSKSKTTAAAPDRS